jgi:hypothetical protein
MGAGGMGACGIGACMGAGGIGGMGAGAIGIPPPPICGLIPTKLLPEPAKGLAGAKPPPRSGF